MADGSHRLLGEFGESRRGGSVTSSDEEDEWQQCPTCGKNIKADPESLAAHQAMSIRCRKAAGQDVGKEWVKCSICWKMVAAQSMEQHQKSNKNCLKWQKRMRRQAGGVVLKGRDELPGASQVKPPRPPRDGADRNAHVSLSSDDNSDSALRCGRGRSPSRRGRKHSPGHGRRSRSTGTCRRSPARPQPSYRRSRARSPESVAPPPPASLRPSAAARPARRSLPRAASAPALPARRSTSSLRRAASHGRAGPSPRCRSKSSLRRAASAAARPARRSKSPLRRHSPSPRVPHGSRHRGHGTDARSPGRSRSPPGRSRSPVRRKPFSNVPRPHPRRSTTASHHGQNGYAGSSAPMEVANATVHVLTAVRGLLVDREDKP